VGSGKVAAFKGPSEMHARVSAHDWASTPLGPVESWQPSLAVLVKTLLASALPHGAHLQVDSAPGQGATFIVEVPRGVDV